ncbi:MAG: ribosome recycling factor [Paludibacteraceae bacterium]|nr:ribosome recycling factor [Paludibacteraceae bacterium]
MKRSTLTIMDEWNSHLTGYVTLYSYRLANLCIKADPMSLLGVTVDIDGMAFNIDDLAIVAKGDNDFEMKVVPKDEENIMRIGKGIAEEHPEFRQDLDTLTLDDDTECRYIKLTMPEVNEDRKKLMTDAVKTLHDECVAKVKACNTVYTGKIAVDIVGDKAEDVETVNNKVKETKDNYDKLCEEVTKTKDSEIEEAYALYLERKQQEQTQQSEQSAAEGKDTVSKLKLQ